MKGYQVISDRKLKEFIRECLGLRRSEAGPGIDGLAELLKIMLAHDCVETDVHTLANQIGWNTIDREVKKMVKKVWEGWRSVMFQDFYETPKTEEVFYILAALLVTKADLLKKSNGTETAAERKARVNITRYIKPQTVRSKKMLAAYLFLINASEEAISGKEKPYRKSLKDSCFPKATAFQVEALFNAQTDWWDIDTGWLFGRAFPMPKTPEIYYHILKCQCM